MKANIIFKYGLILLSILMLSCNAYKEVEMIRVGDYSVGNMTNEKVAINLNMEVNNPNSYNIRIKKSTLDLYLEGKKVGETQMTNDIVLKKKTQAVYPFTIEANYKDIAGAAMKSVSSLFGKKEVTLGIKGRVKAKALGIGKKFDLDVQEKISMTELMKMAGM